MSLQQRISEKRRELDSLNQIDQLSQDLTNQLEQLEAKLDTLSDGTEGELLLMGVYSVNSFN